MRVDKNKRHEQLAHGAGRWQASRLKPEVKRRGIKNSKKPKGSHGGKIVVTDTAKSIKQNNK